MIKIYKKYEEIINYLIFGVLTTLVSILSYAFFTRLINLDYVLSNILSWILSVTFAFFTNQKYVFNTSSSSKIKDMFKFYLSRLTSLGIELITMYILVTLLSLNDMISKIIVQFIVIVLNYVLSKLFVFKKQEINSLFLFFLIFSGAYLKSC